MLYHVSPASNEESIRRFGILQGDGLVFNLPEWSSGKVFLSADIRSAIEWMDDIHEMTGEDVSLFPVHLTSDLFRRLEADFKAAQEGARGAVFLRHDIPASCVGAPWFSGPGSAAAVIPEPDPEDPQVRSGSRRRRRRPKREGDARRNPLRTRVKYLTPEDAARLQVPADRRFFHVTPARNLPSIQRFGIRRGDGAVFRRPAWSEGKVFLATNEDAAMRWKEAVYNATEEDVAVVAFYLPEHMVARLEVDVKAQEDNIPGAVYIRQDISRNIPLEVVWVGKGLRHFMAELDAELAALTPHEHEHEHERPARAKATRRTP